MKGLLIFITDIWLLSCFAGICFSTDQAYVDRPRGVPLMRKPFYDPSKDFKCLDGSATIPFSQVNDDYCDCDDGTDEPGTSACISGQFNCVNLGHRPLDIPSSRVNDQICDCCDGSDEFAGYVRCPNICDELGRKARDEEQKLLAIQKEGYEKRQQLSKEGKKMKEERQKQLAEIKKEKDTHEPQRSELERIKKDAEQAETEAKKKHTDLWDVEKSRRRAEKERVDASAAFQELDINKDGKISPEELSSVSQFDKDGDGKVSLDEAKQWLGDEEPDLEKFVSFTWDVIKDEYRAKKETEEELKEPPPEPDDVEDFDPDKYKKEGEKSVDEIKKDDDAEEMPPYDEETIKLIDVAEKAREDFNELDKKVRNLETELRKLQDFVDLDLGNEDEFATMVGQCYEMEDLQYVYKLCPFDKASQRGKSGGAETSLGSWGTWSGPHENRYSHMKYEHGQGCWSGPDRSALVKLVCGIENKLLSASEPSRCEYAMDFATPAACLQPGHVPHTEL